ncbi:MAG TPA: YihY/virulence factor BrkB family protein [Gammaproteobacteria bacterium]|nr:YihY/virulence factor BrkB family protein [Gammaproteobacteria bacterium]
MNIASFNDKPLKIFIYLYRSYEKFTYDNCSFHAATLTFYTLFALVPFLGLMFGLAQSFGFESVLKTILKELLAAHPQVYENLLVFTNNLLLQTKEQIIAGVGLLILIWSVYKVIWLIDHIFNDIWAIRFQKSPLYRVHQFAALLLLMPIILVILGGFLLQILERITYYLPLIDSDISLSFPEFFRTKLVSVVLFTLLFGLSYWGLPAISVPIFPALISGFVGSLLFHASQLLYIHFQGWITEYGVVYGSFASVPLFMLWVYLSWMIYLFGAEMTHILESKITRSWEIKLNALPIRIQRVLALQIFEVIRERFSKGEPPLDAKMLAHTLKIPRAVTRRILDLLIAAEVLTTTQRFNQAEPRYMPQKSIDLLDRDTIIKNLESSSLYGKPPETFGQNIEQLLEPPPAKTEE